MSNPSSALHDYLIQLTEPILDSLSKTHYTPPESTNISVKSALESYLSFKTTTPPSSSSNPNNIKNFTLAIALISSSSSKTSTPPHESLSWIPKNLPIVATSALNNFAREYIPVFRDQNAKRIGDLGIDCELLLVSEERRLVVEVMCDAVPFLKERIKDSSIGNGDDDEDEVLATSARVPVGYAIMAAYQFRWFVTQVEYPLLGKLCNLVIPCALTALDHWSPEVKGQGMISFIHLARNVNADELGCYEDVILDACCQNIASSDEIWHHVVEMSVLLVTSIQRSNPRSPWFERMLNEMLSHLERQPRNKDRRIAWLKFIEPLLDAVGLVLLAHFRRIFPLFLKWMHSDDDETVLLVLKRVHTVIRLTWIRNTPYVERLVDELVLLYKEAALRRAREEIRTDVLRILTLLQQCKGPQFEAAWDKHRDDPNLKTLSPSLSERNTSNPMALHAEQFQQSDHQRGSESLITQ